MGHTTAIGLKESVEEGLASLDQALYIHLKSNHYPPLPSCLVETCKEVINAYNEGDYDRMIDLPAGVHYRGCTTAPVSACFDAWHLDAFIDNQDD